MSSLADVVAGDRKFRQFSSLDFEGPPVTETPKVGTVEDWVWVNMTGDTHPMHVHLVTFQPAARGERPLLADQRSRPVLTRWSGLGCGARPHPRREARC